MKVFKGISNVLGKDELRPVMQYAIIHEGQIIATNSHVMTLIKLESYGLPKAAIENLEGKVFNKALLDIIQKEDVEAVQFKENSIYLINKKIELKYTYELETGTLNFSDHRYPSYKAILSDEVNELTQIGMSPYNFKLLTDCFPHSKDYGVKMVFDLPNKPIKVSCNNDGGFKGIVMPVALK